jgi:hypothetical protein
MGGKVMFMSRAKIALFIVATCIIWSGEVLAGSATFTLKFASRASYTDPGGMTQQYEAGFFRKGDAIVGTYIIVRRVLTSSIKFNAGTTNITLTFIPNDSTSAPESITMEGVHNISTNAFKGSVSATSSAYSWVRDADAHYTVSAGVETLVIRWEGSDQLVIP